MSIERIQQIDHAKSLLQIRLRQLQKEAEKNLQERGRLWAQMSRLDTERAAIMNSHLVDA